MKKTVDKQKFRRKTLRLAQVYENFSAIFGKGKGEDVGRLILASVNAVELTRKRGRRIHERESVRFTQDPTFKVDEGRALGRALRLGEVKD
jgi:hypothetical protein